MKALYLIACIALLSCGSLASAATLRLSPSEFSVSGVPGDTIVKDVTIYTDGNYAVYLSAPELPGLSANFTSPLIVEHNKTIPLKFHILDDAPITHYTFRVSASLQVAEVPVLADEPSGGGGGSYAPANTSVSNKNESHGTNPTGEQSGSAGGISGSPSMPKKPQPEQPIIPQKVFIILGIGLAAFVIWAMKFFARPK